MLLLGFSLLRDSFSGLFFSEPNLLCCPAGDLFLWMLWLALSRFGWLLLWFWSRWLLTRMVQSWLSFSQELLGLLWSLCCWWFPWGHLGKPCNCGCPLRRWRRDWLFILCFFNWLKLLDFSLFLVKALRSSSLRFLLLLVMVMSSLDWFL